MDRHKYEQSINSKKHPGFSAFDIIDGIAILMLQSETSNGRGGRRKPYHVFTEQGVAMLSSVLNSRRAIQVNIQIMRAFTRLKGFLVSYQDLRERIEAMGRKSDRRFAVVFDAIGRLLDGPEKKFHVKGFSVKKSS